MSAEPASRPETLTFLFTDIEGSTRLLQQLGPERYAVLLADHLRLLRTSVREHGGTEFGSEGDALFVVFPAASGAVAASLEAQRALAAYAWPAGAAVRVRMGLHTGEATRSSDGFVGIDVHRAARIAAAGHGGQVLLSQTARDLVAQALPAGAWLRDLGQHRLKDLARPEHLFQLGAPDLPADFPPPRSLEAIVHNLPTQLTSFVGREREVADAIRLLEHARLLTLTGPGGTGKTRLSLQVAEAVADTFADGICFVSLAPVREPELVASTIAQALGLRDSSVRRPLDAVIDHLRSRRVLLVLDNFEQVRPAATDVAELLRAAPGVTVLASSRAALHISGEQELPVPPLGLPDAVPSVDPAVLARSEAIALFVARARAVLPGFALTTENAAAVAEICRRMDGLPLAIELAAARIGILPPRAMLARLTRRLELPGAGARDLPDRQRTLRGAISWSHELLEPPAQRLLARLSVFAGGATLDAAETVCGPARELGIDVLDGLSALVDESLVRQSSSDGEPRFWMLETIREFAAERLVESGEGAEVAAKHAAWFLALAERAAPELTGPDQKHWLDVLAADHDDVRAALAWFVESSRPEEALRLGSAAWRFWQMRGHLVEAADRLARVLDMPGSAAVPMARARALEAAGGVAYWRNDMAAAEALYEEALKLCRAHGSKADVANALYNFSFPFNIAGSDLPRARELLEESLAIYREVGDPQAVARGLWALGTLRYFEGDYGPARDMLGESLALFRTFDDRFLLAWSLRMFGLASHRLGANEPARAAWLEALDMFQAAGDSSGIAMLLNDFSGMALQLGDVPRAVRLAGASAAVQRASGSGLATVVNTTDGRPSVNEADLRDPDALAVWAEGQAMPPDAAIAYAREPGAAGPA